MMKMSLFYKQTRTIKSTKMFLFELVANINDVVTHIVYIFKYFFLFIYFVKDDNKNLCRSRYFCRKTITPTYYIDTFSNYLKKEKRIKKNTLKKKTFS